MGKNNKEAQLGKNKKNKRTRRDTKMCYKHFVKRLKEAPLKDKEKRVNKNKANKEKSLKRKRR